MIMAQALFKVLRDQDSGVALDLLAPQWTVPLASRMPEIRDAITLPFGHGDLKLRNRFKFAKSLRARGYRQAIVLPNTFKSALIPMWAKIPERTGYVGESRQWLLNDCRKLDTTRYPRQVQRYASLGLPLGAVTEPPLPRLKTNDVQFNSVLRTHNLDVSQPVLVLCPGAEFGPAKQWPVPYFVEVANHYLGQQWQVWLLGSARDRSTTDEINALTEHQCHNLAGRTTLVEVCDLISRAAMVVSNDSGLMHVAASYDRNLVCLFGSSSPAYTPPLSSRSVVLSLELDCSPCFQRDCPYTHKRCMMDLKPQRVLDATELLLASIVATDNVT